MKELLGDALLIERRTKADAPAQVFRTLDQKNFDDFLTLWRPKLEEARGRVASWGEAAQVDAQDSHWEWVDKAVAAERIMGRDTFAIECADLTQGLMLVDVNYARLPGLQGKELVYIELLATAPWNRPRLDPNARYKGVGRVLVETAISLSVDLGFGGRIGLHSLPQSESWYRTAGFTAVEFDDDKDMRYFEMPEADALSYISI